MSSVRGKGVGGGFDKTVYFFPAEDGRQVQRLLRIRREVRAPRLLQRLDIEEPDSPQMLDNGVELELSFAEQIRLVLAAVLRPDLVTGAPRLSPAFAHL